MRKAGGIVVMHIAVPRSVAKVFQGVCEPGQTMAGGAKTILKMFREAVQNGVDPPEEVNIVTTITLYPADLEAIRLLAQAVTGRQKISNGEALAIAASVVEAQDGTD